MTTTTATPSTTTQTIRINGADNDNAVPAKKRLARIVKRQQQTVKHKGKRVRLVTVTRADGTVSVTMDAPEVLEIDLQAEAVKHLKRMPQYAKTADDVLAGRGDFTIAADQNGSGFRGRNAAVKLKAAGMAAGEPDLRVYLRGGTLKAIEFKGEKGDLEDSQQRRFPLLRALGFEIHVVQASTVTDAAAQAIALVRGWLAANDGANSNDTATHKPASARLAYGTHN